jgi:type IV pilus assembly protein PilF
MVLLAASSPVVRGQVVIPETGHTGQVSTDARTQATLHTELAAFYFQNESFSVALEESAAAIAADPTYAPAFTLRGLIYASLHDLAAAEGDFKRSLSLAPNDPEINNNYGWFLCQYNDPVKLKASIPYFLNAVKNPLYSTPGRAYTNAGNCALKMGDGEAARNYLLNALRVSQDGAPQAQVLLAQLAYAEGNLNEARNRLLEVFQLGWQPSPEALWLGIRIERKMGRPAEEKSLLAQLRRLYPSSPEYQEYLKGNF